MGEVVKVLDLFSGLGGWSAAFLARGHQVVTLDLEPRFNSDIQVDILNVTGLGTFDVILASPPCETFSVMSIGKYWTGGRGAYEPKNDKARLGLAIMNKTFALIDAAKPKFYVIENPRGVMRKVAPRKPNATTWYCRWGMPYAKPTDLWTNIQGEWPTCRNGSDDHAAAPRGSALGIQGLTRAEIKARIVAGERITGYHVDKRGELRKHTAMEMETYGTTPEARAVRALIPYRLSLAVCFAAEEGGTLPNLKVAA